MLIVEFFFFHISNASQFFLRKNAMGGQNCIFFFSFFRTFFQFAQNNKIRTRLPQLNLSYHVPNFILYKSFFTHFFITVVLNFLVANFFVILLKYLIFFLSFLRAKQIQNKTFSTFSCMFLNPNIFSNLNSNCSNLYDVRNLQEQVKKAFCCQKLF